MYPFLLSIISLNSSKSRGSSCCPSAYINSGGPLGSSSNSSEFANSGSPGYLSLLESPSGPNVSPDLCLNVKWNISIFSIHLLIVALGPALGLLSIPLIYFASVSTMSFLQPINQYRISSSALSKPNSSRLG